MDCGGVRLAVDSRDLPSAAADTAEAPLAGTKRGIREFAMAGNASALASIEKSDCVSAIEHSFESYRIEVTPPVGSAPGR